MHAFFNHATFSAANVSISWTRTLLYSFYICSVFEKNLGRWKSTSSFYGPWSIIRHGSHDSGCQSASGMIVRRPKSENFKIVLRTRQRSTPCGLMSLIRLQVYCYYTCSTRNSAFFSDITPFGIFYDDSFFYLDCSSDHHAENIITKSSKESDYEFRSSTKLCSRNFAGHSSSALRSPCFPMQSNASQRMILLTAENSVTQSVFV